MTKRNLWIVSIEPIPTRYTLHWHQYMYGIFANHLDNEFEVNHVGSEEVSSSTPGGFLNFTSTVKNKSLQMTRLAELFEHGAVNTDDVFLMMDYWNPAVHFIRYMSILSGKPVKICGICHAGMWDPADILGQKFSKGHSDWGRLLENSMDEAYDRLFFATEFSKSLYQSNVAYSSDQEKYVVTGFPMEYYDHVMPTYWDLKNSPTKEDIIVFPHRKSPEKQLHLFEALRRVLGNKYEFVVSMDVCKTKDEYHDLLYRSKMVFSASLQETLGISMFEALRAGAFPLMPNRLSYAEMYSEYPVFLYTEGDDVVDLVEYHMVWHSEYLDMIRRCQNDTYENYFKGNKMFQEIRQL